MRLRQRFLLGQAFSKGIAVLPIALHKISATLTSAPCVRHNSKRDEHFVKGETLAASLPAVTGVLHIKVHYPPCGQASIILGVK